MTSNDIPLILGVLSFQAELEKLKIDIGKEFFLNDTHKDALLCFPFKLKRLELVLDEEFHDIHRCVSREFINLLKIHLATLQKLSLHTCSDLSPNEEIMRFVLHNINNIQILVIAVDKLPSVETSWFWNGIEPLRSVQELEVRGHFLDIDVARKFFALFPLLRSLNIFFCSLGDQIEVLHELPTLLPHLQHLKIDDLDYELHHHLVFPQLKKLEFGYTHSNIFIHLINDHRQSLEEISIYTEESRMFLAINDCPNLKFLSLSFACKLLYNDFEYLLLKTTPWIVKFKYWKLDFSNNHWRCEIFHFPDDKEIFKRLWRH